VVVEARKSVARCVRSRFGCCPRDPDVSTRNEAKRGLVPASDYGKGEGSECMLLRYDSLRMASTGK
jgi:hypothetical protein